MTGKMRTQASGSLNGISNYQTSEITIYRKKISYTPWLFLKLEPRWNPRETRVPRIYWQTALVEPSTPPPATPGSGPAPLHHFATLNSIFIMGIHRVVQHRGKPVDRAGRGSRKRKKKTQSVDLRGPTNRNRRALQLQLQGWTVGNQRIPGAPERIRERGGAVINGQQIIVKTYHRVGRDRFLLYTTVSLHAQIGSPIDVH